MKFICWDADDPDNDYGSRREVEVPDWSNAQAAACKWAEGELDRLSRGGDDPRFSFDVWTKDEADEKTHWCVDLEVSYIARAMETTPRKEAPPAPAETPEKVIDLMEALREALKPPARS